MWLQTRVGQKALVECIDESSSPNAFLHVISLRKLIGKRCSRFCMPSCYGMRYGGEDWSVLPVIIRLLLMHSINTLSRAPPLFLYNAYFSLLQFTRFRSFHSGSLRKRTWWRTRHLVMIIDNLLIWVCRYLETSLLQRSCAGSCIPSS